MKNKNGFTIIEIIVCISLLLLVGTGSFFGIKLISSNITIRELNEISDKIYEAANVYLETNNEVKERLYNDKEAVVLPLSVLQNEGLITFNDINIKEHSVLLTLGSTDPNSKCIDSTVVGTWEKENDTVIYLCTDISDELKNLPTTVSDLSTRISNLEATVSSIDVTNKADKSEVDALKSRIEDLESAMALIGSGGNNWVLFDVTADTSKVASWSDVNEDLWNVVGISNGKIKLMYNTYVTSKNSLVGINNELVYGAATAKCEKGLRELSGSKFYANSTLTNHYKNGKFKKIDINNFSWETEAITATPNIFYNTENNIFYAMTDTDKYCDIYDSVSFGSNPIDNLYRKLSSGATRYTQYYSNTDFFYTEMFNDTYQTSGAKKKVLYEHINLNLRNKISEENYYYEYNTSMSIRTDKTYSDKLGTLSAHDNLSNIKENLIGKAFVIGVYNSSSLDSTYTGYIGISNGEVVTVPGIRTYTLVLNPSSNWKTCKNLDNNRCNGEILQTRPYLPVITLDKNQSPTLLTNLSQYPDSYKNKYTTCTNNNQLGTKECPRILKFSDGTYSNG